MSEPLGWALFWRPSLALVQLAATKSLEGIQLLARSLAFRSRQTRLVFMPHAY